MMGNKLAQELMKRTGMGSGWGNKKPQARTKPVVNNPLRKAHSTLKGVAMRRMGTVKTKGGW